MIKTVYKFVFLSVLALFVFSVSSFAEEKSEVGGPINENTKIVQDLQLKAKESVTFGYDPNGQILVFDKGFSMTVGPTEFKSEKAVFWLVKYTGDSTEKIDYTMTGFLQGKVHLNRGTQVISEQQEMAVWFFVNGDVSITADRKKTSDPRGTKLYAAAYKKMQGADIGPTSEKAKPIAAEKNSNKTSVVQASELSKPPKEIESSFRYPINLAPQGEEGIKTQVEDNIATLTGGFYLSQKRDVEGKLLFLEMQADNAVIYLPENKDEK